MTVPKVIGIVLLPLALAGCVTGAPLGLEDPLAGFSTIDVRSVAVNRKGAVWIQNQTVAAATAQKVRQLALARPLSADTAVEIALLNNKGLQASYAEIGLAGAELWQESLPDNPSVAVGITAFNPIRAIEATVIRNILSAATRPQRVAVAETRFRQAQLRAAEATLRLANETREAWVNAVAARERISYLSQAQTAADAASELAQKLGETGAYPKAEQGREHAFFAELSGEVAEARLEARTTREALTRQLGLWGQDIDYKLPGSLPQLPPLGKARPLIESDALRNRVDLDIAKLELDALARSYGLTKATRLVSDLQLAGRVELEFERETTNEGTTRVDTVGTPSVELEFAIPLFDSGQARLRAGEMQYLKAANLVAQKAVNVRSEAREAYDRYRSTYEIARHYRNSVVPLRQKIEEQSVLTYNGMITSTFVLLADTRGKLNAILLSLNAKRNFWLAESGLRAAVFGGGGGGGGGDAAEVAVASAESE